MTMPTDYEQEPGAVEVCKTIRRIVGVREDAPFRDLPGCVEALVIANEANFAEVNRLRAAPSREPEGTAAEWFNAYQQVDEYLIEKLPAEFELPHLEGGQQEMVANTIAMIEALAGAAPTERGGPTDDQVRTAGATIARNLDWIHNKPSGHHSPSMYFSTARSILTNALAAATTEREGRENLGHLWKIAERQKENGHTSMMVRVDDLLGALAAASREQAPDAELDAAIQRKRSIDERGEILSRNEEPPTDHEMFVEDPAGGLRSMKKVLASRRKKPTQE